MDAGHTEGGGGARRDEGREGDGVGDDARAVEAGQDEQVGEEARAAAVGDAQLEAFRVWKV